MKYILKLIYLLTVTLLVSCSQNMSDNYTSTSVEYLSVPSHFPEPVFPENNPYSKEKAELGRYLFYEPLLVQDTSFPSCSHCMKQEAAFCNNEMLPRGFKGIPEYRNTPTLVNAVYRDKLCWDGRANAIERNAYRSMTLRHIFAADTNELVRRMENSPLYSRLFAKAYGKDTKIQAYMISNAIATFVRTFISGTSRYDRYINGDKTAMTEQEIAGMNLFNSSRTNCSHCHSGIFFTDMQFHNTGVNTEYFDKGRYKVTQDYNDRGKFLTPTLRNVARTAPYMHGGYLNTLDDVLEHYNRGGAKFHQKDTMIRKLNLTQEELDALKAFLHTLTDEDFLNDKRFSNPHKIIKFTKK